MAYVPGVALLAVLVGGCSAGSGADAPAADGKPGSPTVVAAAPGKYRTLPSSCRAVPPSMLKDLLPGTAELPKDQQEKMYEGTAAVTYDTDRKVGCRWKAESPDASRTLAIDFERVVSYDPAVSDDDRAREVYAKHEDAAGLMPSATPDADADADADAQATPSDTPSGSGTGASATPPAAPSAEAPSAEAPSAEASGTTSPDAGDTTDKELQPRVLEDLADAAFLDDALTQPGSAAQHRTVSVVFRTSNVIVTVQYTEQPAFVTEVPDSRELQDKARALARKLADTLSE